MNYFEWKTWKKSIANSENSGKMNARALGGALTSKNDPNFKKREEFAKSYYAEVLGRKREYEIAAVAKNSGFNEEDVSKVLHTSLNWNISFWMDLYTYSIPITIWRNLGFV